MIQRTKLRTTLQEFLSFPESGTRCELIDGNVIPKVAPKRFHSRTQRTLLRYLEDWGAKKGEIGVEWAVVLTRQGQDWVPVPDLSFTYFERLPDDLGDDACPVPMDLAIEIISPAQSFGAMAEKATDYLAAGVGRVWVVDPRSLSITVFKPDAPPVTYRGDRPLTDDLFPSLNLVPQAMFREAGLLS